MAVAPATELAPALELVPAWLPAGPSTLALPPQAMNKLAAVAQTSEPLRRRAAIDE
jgi:hypothetical protein